MDNRKYICDICTKDCVGLKSYAGHRSSHFRNKVKIKSVCENPTCDNEVIVNVRKNNTSRYCSKNCMYEHRRHDWNNKQAFLFGDFVNITNAELMEYRKNQETCEICGSKETLSRSLAADHDHVTLQFRGLLCYKCNTGLGWYERNKDKLEIYVAL